MRPTGVSPTHPAAEAIPPQCGPFLWAAETRIPFPDFAPYFVVVAIQETPRAREGRSRVRDAIQQILSSWGGTSHRLIETPEGPVVLEPLLGRRLRLSISYAANTAWLALATGAPIGVDAVALGDCGGWEDIAPVFLDSETLQQIKTAADPRLSFARAWATLEARFKRAGLPLRENCIPPEARTFLKNLGDTVVAVAFAR